MTRRTFIPALSYHALTPLYDVVAQLVVAERKFKELVIRAADVRPGDRLLDVGCGTGTLLQLAGRAQPGAELVGMDADARILEMARRKLAASGIQASLDEGLASSLPYADETFDRVVSTLMLHHLPRAEKENMLRESLRVLRPGGRAIVGDFGPPHGRFAAVISRVVERLSTEPIGENYRGELMPMFGAAGFGDYSDIATMRTMFGTLHVISATK
jgi:ubiquinone/menaquinone biosynthesis C-methylase UbiE